MNLRKPDETVTYHVRYKPANLNEWWDWAHESTPEKAVAIFARFPKRFANAREAHVVKTTITTKEDNLGPVTNHMEPTT